MRELRRELARESDRAKREQLIARMLDHVQIRWEQLFTSVSNEQNPERMLLMLAELDEIFESRKA